MKKRFFAIFLAVCLVATLLPAGVLAADGTQTIRVGGVGLTSTDGGTVYATTDSEGKVTIGGSEDSYNVKWDGTTLTLNGATIKGNSGNGIVYREGDLTISLEGTNKIGEENDIYSAGSGIYVKGSLTVTGSGTLGVLGLNRGITARNARFSGGTVNATAAATATAGGDYPMGIYAGSVTVDGGTVTAETKGADGYGIYTDTNGGGVTVTDGSVTAKGKENGIQTQGNVNISGGKVVAEGGNVGIWVAPYKGFSIKITGGEVTVTGGWRSFYENVTIGPEKAPAIMIEYGDSASDDDKIERVVYRGETDTYNGNDRYFHSSTETDIDNLANITVGGVGLYGTDYRIAYAKTDGDGKVTTEGATANDYNIKWDGTTLTLKGATIEVDRLHDGIEYSGTSAITIQLEDVNNVTGDYGIEGRNAAKLTISGSGTLDVNGVGSHAIYAGGNIEISDATVIATGAGDSSDGIYTYGGDIIINSGKVTVECKDDGLNASDGNVVINGGDVSVDSGGHGVYAGVNHSLTIRGGTVTIEADTKLIYVTKINNKNNRTVTIAPQDGATIAVKAGADEQSAAEITIPDGGEITDSVSGAKYFHSETSGGTPPTITNVTVTPADAKVEVGETQKFNATVTGKGDYYNRSVVWTVSGSSNAGTFISSNGVLTVATDEKAEELTVTATAVGDSNKSADATVTVKQPATITGVTVTPATATVEAGKTQEFTAKVTGTGDYNENVTWTVSGKKSDDTTISEDGVLTVATDETATTLTVTATAVGDSKISATATVTVKQPATITGVTVDPDTATVEVGETLRFTAEVEGTGYYNRSVVWTVSGNNSAGTFISSNGLLTVATGETAEQLTVTATADGDKTKSGTATVTVTHPATITNVTVTPATATVEAGGTQQFTAAVIGTGNVSKEVTWSVSGSNAGTTISENGLLTVADNETAATLTVTATAVGNSDKSATATVTVTQPDPDEPWNPGGGTTGNRYCYLTFETRGGSEIDSLRVKLGETVSLDEYLSERAGFDFAGWYSDDSFAERVDELYMNGSKTVYAAWEPFDDAGRGDWFYDSVVYVYENGLMDGVSDTMFDPDGTVTRAQLVTMLWRLDGEPSVNYALPFTDVSGGEWYAEAVRWAAGEGIVNGVSETEFAPNAAVTREQLAAILHRYAQYKGYDVSIGESTNILSYSDFASISEYAISAMQWVCGEGIITGVTESALEPRGTATRAQSAAILMRFIEG